VGEPSLFLGSGRERSVLRRHPWVFAGAVRRVEGGPAAGETVAIRTDRGRFLARAAYSPSSQIAARIWSWDEDDKVDDEFIASRVRRAAAARSDLVERTDASRLVFAESDGLPGVIADRYDDHVVVQLSSAGADHWRPAVAEALAALPGVTGVSERSDLDVRQREGLSPRTGRLRGHAPPPSVTIAERPPADGPGWTFIADVVDGHKTGFYLDQRDNRLGVAELAAGRRVLDLFCYTGAFAVAAAAGGASSVVAVDSSAPALELAATNIERNGGPGVTDDVLFVQADVFTQLRRLRDEGARFDLIVADPPKLARSTSQLNRATRAYKDLNLLALKLLAPGGVLVTFSCSGLLTAELFQKVLFGAALDAGRDAQVIGRLTQATDHPVLLTFPEAEYLKGLVLRVS
jgi:23S rRNA (cytosine1962-C5)-methyltransferase